MYDCTPHFVLVRQLDDCINVYIKYIREWYPIDKSILGSREIHERYLRDRATLNKLLSVRNALEIRSYNNMCIAEVTVQTFWPRYQWLKCFVSDS